MENEEKTFMQKMGIEAAQKQEQSVYLQSATGEDIYRSITHCEQNIKHATMAIKVYKQRLEAIEAGNFELVSTGGPGTQTRIQYTDAVLNVVV